MAAYDRFYCIVFSILSNFAIISLRKIELVCLLLYSYFNAHAFVCVLDPQVTKPFSCSTQLSTKFQLLIKTNMLENKDFIASKFSDGVFIMLISLKMPTIVGILTFMSLINFILSCLEHAKCFITAGPVVLSIECIFFNYDRCVYQAYFLI